MSTRKCKGLRRNKPHTPHVKKKTELPLALGAERVPLASASLDADRKRLAELRARQEAQEREMRAKSEAEPVYWRGRR